MELKRLLDWLVQNNINFEAQLRDEDGKPIEPKCIVFGYYVVLIRKSEVYEFSGRICDPIIKGSMGAILDYLEFIYNVYGND